MTLRSIRELENTRKKLKILEDHVAARSLEKDGNGRVRQWTMISLNRLINQMKEEIARFEARRPAKTLES